ncbi:MAG: MFS transporter [Xanthomonadales bacterium]|nr:MFS transporter [Gammaproteobacteria bacterium]MBT8054007.1 MFS transporter [Gammaproteobacteria bacterium]NND56983.1 MFS transporter [Xanthomonadales bacterium]NNK51941.1 MFS transporter [Xanthomonadales bacterium]
MTLVGYAVLVGVPVISTAWVELLGFTEEQVGRVAGADLGGLSLGAVITSLFVARINRRRLVLVSVAIVVLSNGLCTVFTDYETVLWLRVGAGFGSGIYTAVAVATLGGTSKPARAYNLMLFAFAFSQALEMQVLPMLSMNGIYLAFIGCYLIGLPFLRWIPAHPIEKVAVDSTDQAEVPHVPAYIPWLVLAAIFFTYINIGSYWTYIELASLKAGIDAEYVGRLLVWTSFFSLIGCAVATVISNRFGLARPLLIALFTMAAIVGMLSVGINDVNILVSMFSFNLLWIFVDVYQMATVANVDRSGAFASLMPGAQGLGQIVGPNLAATILGAGMGYSKVFIMCALAALAGMSIYGAMYLRLRKTIPSLAKAT